MFLPRTLALVVYAPCTKYLPQRMSLVMRLICVIHTAYPASFSGHTLEKSRVHCAEIMGTPSIFHSGAASRTCVLRCQSAVNIRR